MLTKKGKEKLEKYGWTVVPEGVWFGVDYADSHKTNVLNTLTEILCLDEDAEGYNFLVCAYKEENEEDE
jgi:hypothetical protein